MTPSTRRSAHQRLYAAISSSWSCTTWSISAMCRVDSSASRPEMKAMKKCSRPSTRAGRAMMQADGVGTGAGQRPRRAVRLPADLLGDGEDALAGDVGHPRLTVEGVGDRALGHAGAYGDVRDRRPLHQVILRLRPSRVTGTGR